MSATRLIDGYRFRFRVWTTTLNVMALCMVAVLSGCSPSERVAKEGKESNEPKVDANAVPESNANKSSFQSDINSETSAAATHGQSTDREERVQLTAEQLLPPKDALALRQEAKQLAEELIRRFPNNPDALEVKARFLMLFGETEEAKKCWLSAIEVDANYAYALQGLGKVAILNSEFDQAIEYLKKSIAGQPGNAYPVHDLSDAYMKSGKLDESIACLRTYADNNPTSALTFLLLGQSYIAKERFEDAEAAFRTVLQISPDQPRAENGLATVLLRLGKRDEAKQLLAKQKVGRKANDKNRLPEEVFQDELKELSNRFQTVAEFYAVKGDQRNAEAIARRALVLNATNIQTKVLLINILQKQDRLKESLELNAQLCADDKENPRWHQARGAMLCLLGDTLSAREAYEDVVRLAPANPVGYDLLARLAIGTGKDLASAIGHAKKLVEIRGSASDHELLAQAYAVNADYTSAYDSLSEAIRRDPANGDYIEAMGHLQRVMKKPE